MAILDKDKLKALYTSRELADYLKVSMSTLNRIISRREITPHIIGRGRRFDEDEVGRYLLTRKSRKA